jgi:hypothetical protein
MSALDKVAIIASGRHRTVGGLLDAFHLAAAKSDFVRYMGCFATTGRFLGTDPGENWCATEFFDYARPHFAAGQGWTYKLIPGTRKSTCFPSEEESTMQFCIFDELLLNETFGTCRGTGSLVYDREEHAWLIASYHLSFPVPNDIAMEITQLLAKADTHSRENQAEVAAAELLAELEAEGAGESASAPKKKKQQKKKK